MTAGDGGLREALEELAEHWRYKSADLKAWQEGGGPDPYEAGLDDAATALKKLLAAPAVPQPVDREALPTRYQLMDAMRAVLGSPGCHCDLSGKTDTLKHYGHMADAVLAMLAGSEVKP